MARFHVITDAVTGNVTTMQFTPEEEAAFDAIAEVLPPLDPWRFWAVVELSGLTEAGLYAAIDAQPSAAFKAIARAKLRNPPGGKFHRSDPLFADAGLLSALNMTAAQIDALWSQASGLPA